MLWQASGSFLAIFVALMAYRFYLEKAKKGYQNWTGPAAQAALATSLVLAAAAAVTRR